MRTGARIFGAVSGILSLFLLIGLLLPGTWHAEADTLLSATPASIFPYLNRLEAWKEWTPFPESGLEGFGAVEGPGAGVRWGDPAYGSGEARILESVPNRRVDYEVRIESGRLLIRGRITLEPEGDETRVRWVEEGDFGWNPLMGYTARRMASSQGEAMRASLTRLAIAIAEGRLAPSVP